MGRAREVRKSDLRRLSACVYESAGRGIQGALRHFQNSPTASGFSSHGMEWVLERHGVVFEVRQHGLLIRALFVIYADGLYFFFIFPPLHRLSTFLGARA